jgi:CDGSH-type Zn-finger protein
MLLMARLIRHDATGPQELKPQEKSAWVCMCGLSQNLPLCDGAHKLTKQEQAGQCVVYDKERMSVVEIKDDA